MGQKVLTFRNSIKRISNEIDPRALPNKKESLDIIDLETLQISEGSILYTNSKSENCLSCMGKKLNCGKSQCPIVAQFTRFIPLKQEFSKKNLFGASPPSVFIGRQGYPKVFVGPMVPPTTGDTSIMDETEFWWNMDINNIIDMRMNLVRCKSSLNVNAPSYNNQKSLSNKFLDTIQEVGLAKNSIEMEVNFSKIPKKNILLDADIQPMGPTAPMESIIITSNSTDHNIQTVFDDTDLSATKAIIKLKYKKNNQTSITRAFSSGLMGLGNNRKLVPTRWSITAVDSTLGIHYWKNILHYPLINEFRIYQSDYLHNKFIIIMMPDYWGYELIEAFFPGSCWNPGQKIAIGNDWEGLKGRKTYARIGGCYYAARNMIGEYLHSQRRQARVTILRETYPEFTMPLGVWFTRESVRNALEKPYLKLDSKQEVLSYINSNMKIPSKYWVDTSGVLKRSNEMKQKSVYQYFS